MNLKEFWKPKEDGPAKPVALDKSKLLKNSCLHPMCALKRNIMYNFYLGVAIMGLWVYLISVFPQWQIRVCFVLIAAVTAYMLWDTYKIFKGIDTQCTEDIHLLQELKLHCDKIEKWIKNSSILGLLMYPFSVSGGFFIGALQGSGLTVDDLLDKPKVIWSLIIAIAILTPLSYLLTRWMNHLAFGKHLQKVKDMIQELEE